MSDDHPPTQARRWHQGYEEIVVAAILLVGCLFFRLRIESFVLGREGSFLGPEFWPATLLTIGAVLSAIYLVLAVIWARRESERLSAEEHAARQEKARVHAERASAAGGTTTAKHEAVHLGEDATTHVGGDPAHTGSVFKLVGGFVLLAAYIYLLAPIGFVPATILFSIAFMLLVGERRWYVLLLFPIVAVTILLGIFTQLLVVSLPRGTGFLLDLSTYLY